MAQNHQSHPAAGALPPGPSVIRLSCIGLFSTGPKLDNFCTKKFTLGSNPLSLNKILAALLVALWLQKRANYDRNDVKIAICCRKITKITQTLEALPPGSLCNKLELIITEAPSVIIKSVIVIGLARGLN